MLSAGLSLEATFRRGRPYLSPFPYVRVRVRRLGFGLVRVRVRETHRGRDTGKQGTHRVGPAEKSTGDT